MFAAKEAADAGNKSEAAVFEGLAADLGVIPPDVRPDWYGRADLACHKILARIADVGVPPTPDKTVQLLYPGASYFVTPPQPLGRGLNNPTELYARARSGRIWMVVRDAANPSDFQKIWVDVSRTPLQEVVLVPGGVQTVTVPGPTQAPKRAWLPVPRPLRYLFRGVWYDGNDPIIDHHDGITHMDADRASHLASVIPVECHKKAPELVKEIDPNARNIQVLRYRDVRNPHEFEILTHPTNPRHWSGWEYKPGQKGRGTWIRERLFVDQFLVSWD